MKRTIQIVGRFGIFVLLLGLCLMLTVAAIDTPWIPISPNTDSTESTESSESSKSSAVESEKSPDSSEQESTASIAPTQTVGSLRAEPKKGCNGTVSGSVLLFSLAIAVAAIGRKKSI